LTVADEQGAAMSPVSNGRRNPCSLKARLARPGGAAGQVVWAWILTIRLRSSLPQSVSNWASCLADLKNSNKLAFAGASAFLECDFLRISKALSMAQIMANAGVMATA
jgi:hypothetical protein